MSFSKTSIATSGLFSTKSGSYSKPANKSQNAFITLHISDFSLNY